MNKTFTSFLGLASLGLLMLGCSQSQLSERDIQRQKDVNAADVKKSELESIAGNYEGELKSGDIYTQNVRLTLETRDVPVVKEGSVDPIMTPKLLGGMRFLIGSEDLNEYVDATIKEAEYSRLVERVEIVVAHEQFGDLYLSLVKKDSRFEGSWRAPAVGTEGTTSLEKKD